MFGRWLIDDAAISFAYARNFIHGHGLVSQPGVPPVEGYSNGLWVFLCSPLFLDDPIDPSLRIKVLSGLLVWAAFATLHRAVRRYLCVGELAPYVTFGLLAALACSTSFVVWTCSGLENPLYACLVAVYLLLVLRHGHGEGRAVSAAGAALVAVSLAMTRPDGVLFGTVLPLVVLLRPASQDADATTKRRELASYVITGLLLGGVFLAFRLAYFGDLYPNTYHAKGGPSLSSLWRIVTFAEHDWRRNAAVIFSIFGWTSVAMTIAILLPMLVPALRLSRPAMRIQATWLMALVAFLIYALLPGDWMGEWRFATPLIMMAWTCAFVAIAQGVACLRGRWATRRRLVLAAAALVILAHAAWMHWPRTRAFAEEPTVPFERVVSEYGLRFNDYADRLGIDDATMLCPDLGGTLYFSRHRVIDLAGLADREIAQLRKHEPKVLRDYVLGTLKPTFVHVHDPWARSVYLHDDPRFAVDYAPIVAIPVGSDPITGQPRYYNGEWVRRDALTDLSKLEALQQWMQTNPPLPALHDSGVVAFPRD